MFVIIYFAFVQLGFLLFGIQVSKLHFQGVRKWREIQTIEKTGKIWKWKVAEFDNKKWREIQTIEKYENNLNIINGGKIQILDKNVTEKLHF